MPDLWQSTSDHSTALTTPAPAAAQASGDDSGWQSTADEGSADHATAGSHVSAFLNGLKTAPILHPIDAIGSIISMARHPEDTVNQIMGDFDRGQQRATDAWNAGQYAPAIIHSGLSMIPLIGPAIDQHYQEMKDAEARGDTVGEAAAAGKLVGIGASAEIARRAPDLIAKAPQAAETAANAGGKVSDAARATASGVKAAAPGLAGAAAMAGAGEVLAQIPGMEWPARIGLGYPAARAVAGAVQKGVSAAGDAWADLAQKRAAAAQAVADADQAAKDLAQNIKATSRPALPPVPRVIATPPPEPPVDTSGTIPTDPATGRPLDMGPAPSPEIAARQAQVPLPENRQLPAPAEKPPIVAGPITPSDSIAYNPPAIPASASGPLPTDPETGRPLLQESPAAATPAPPQPATARTPEQIAGVKNPPRVATLDELAHAYGKAKTFAKLAPAEQATVRGIYEHINAGPTDTTPITNRAPAAAPSDPLWFLTPEEKAARLASPSAPDTATPEPAAQDNALPQPRGVEDEAPSSLPISSRVVDMPKASGEGPGTQRVISEEGARQFANNQGITEDDAQKTLSDQGYTVLGRSQINRALHAIGGNMGLDHDALSDAAKIQFRVKSMTQLSQEQMLELYDSLAGKRSISDPLEGKAQLTGLNQVSGPATIREDQSNVRQGTTGTAPQGTPTAEPVSPGSANGPAAAQTEVLIPGEGRSFPARYAVRELNDIQASHSGLTFNPNPNYELTNDRDYSRADNQGKILQGALPGQFRPAFHITDNPDATNGPPLVDSGGNVIGGNGRTMTLQRVYQYNPTGADAYKQMLAQKAPQFGIDPNQVSGMRRPVLVREISDENIGNPQEAVTDFNKVGTAQLRPSERAIADSRRVSQDTLDSIASRLEAAGNDATLADITKGKAGGDILNRLIDDGAITPQERVAYATGDTLTKEGQARVSQLMLGRFFRDPTQLDTVAPLVRNKLERLAAPLSSLEKLGDWNLTPRIQQGLDLLDDARAHGVKNLDDFVRQNSLLSSDTYSPEALEMAKTLQGVPQRQLVDAITRYTEDARHYSADPGLFPEGETQSPEESFSAALQHARQ